jgi:V/A-type H+-transporting ATPase subunit F
MKISVLGDTHTVSAFRLAGVTGIVADSDTVCSSLRELMGRQDMGLIIITRELADLIPPELRRAELERPLPVIVEIPGIDDRRGLSDSALAGIAEALGLPL